jgi:CRP-like cAMP-binding protein
LFAGYSSLITNEPNKINQQALTDCRLLIINYADVVSLYESYQDFERFGRKLAELFFVHKEEES